MERIPKEEWGEGPWQSETDELNYIDPATGYNCQIWRHPEIGSLCGYVGVPAEHWLYGVSYKALSVDVHGELTFSGPQPDDWYFGFDCAHAGDLIPGTNAFLLKIMPPEHWEKFPNACERDVYRTIDFVKAQIASLALQLNTYGEPND